MQPVVVAAADKTMPRDHGMSRSRHAYWALDADYAPGFRYRVHSYHSPWQQREPHTALLYAPNTPYWEDVSQIKTPHLHSRGLLFHADNLPGCSTWIRTTNDHAVIHDTEGELGTLIDRIIDLGHSQGQSAGAHAQALLWDIIARLQTVQPISGRHFQLTESPPGQTPSNKTEPPFTKAVHAFLRDHLSHPISLADLARHMDLSVSTISHRYQKETGSSPMHKLIEMRLEVAKGMLIRGDRLQQIAEQTGFSDAFHLSKSFTRRFSVSPKQFRQMHAPAQASPPNGDATH